MSISKKGQSLIVKKNKTTKVYPNNKIKIKGKNNTLIINKDLVIGDITDSDYMQSTTYDLIKEINESDTITQALIKVKVKERPMPEHCGTIMIPNPSEGNQKEEYLLNGDNWYNLDDVKQCWDFDGDGVEEHCRINIQLMHGDFTLEAMTWNYDPSIYDVSDGFFEMRVDMVVPEVLNLGKQYKIPEGLDDYMMMIGEVKVINLANDDAFTIQKIQENFSGTLNVNVEQYGEDNMLGYKTTQCSELEINGQIYKIENGQLKLAEVCTVLPKMTKNSTAKMQYVDELDFSNMKFDLDITKICNTYNSWNCFNIESDTINYGFEVVNLSGWDWKHIYERHNEAIKTIMTGNTTFSSYEDANSFVSGRKGQISQMRICFFLTAEQYGSDDEEEYNNRFYTKIILGDLTQEQFDYFCRMCYQDEYLEIFKREGSPRIIYKIID